MTQRIKVEFYGYLPDGQDVKNFDPMEFAKTASATFGFKWVDGVTAVAESRDHARPDMRPDAPPAYFDGVPSGSTWCPANLVPEPDARPLRVQSEAANAASRARMPSPCLDQLGPITATRCPACGSADVRVVNAGPELDEGRQPVFACRTLGCRNYA